MKRSFIYITSIFLLLVFPISAIGINASVHKCNTKHIKQVSFLKLFPPKNVHSCCCNSISKNISNNKALNCSCCSKKEQKKPDESQETSDKSNSIFGYKSSKTNCCEFIKIYHALNSVFISSDNLITFLFINDAHSGECNRIIHKILYSQSINFKKDKFPLKEPINKIISFIHFTSTNGESEIPNQFYC
jgi:hypothetical protein